MARYQIPKDVGDVDVVLTKAGTYAVFSRKSGKNKLRIPCRDKSQAEEVRRRIIDGDHDGAIWT